MALDNVAVARVLSEIADMLELKGENLFKIRAYRSAADIVANSPEQVAALSDAQLREWPGIGKDLSARIREICETGTCQIHIDLAAQFPSTLLELLRLQGVGPKTVALLYSTLGIASIDQLEQAARSGRLRELKGMGPRKEQLLIQALEQQRQHSGRHLLADTAAVANQLIEYLQGRVAEVEFIAVGSLRRATETCGDIDVLAVGAGPEVMDTFSSYPLVDRVMGRGDTKASILIRGGYQADLRLVPRESRGAAMQYFTGSKPHNIVLRDRAIDRGLRLNEYGLFNVADNARLAGDTEESIEAKSKPPLNAVFRRSSRRAMCAAICTCTRPRRTAKTISRQWCPPHVRQGSCISQSPTTAKRSRWRTDSTSAALWSMRRVFATSIAGRKE